MSSKKGMHHYKNLYEIQAKIDNLWGKNSFTILENFDTFKYSNVHQHIKVRCNKCNHVYEKRINTFFHNFGCKYCAGRYFSTSDEMKKYVNESTNGEYILVSDTYKTRDIGTFFHNSKSCRNPTKTFNMKIHNFTVLKQRCPFCNSTSKGIILSHGNIKIREYLDCHKIKYEEEYCIEGCRNSKSNILLSFDIYIPEYKLLIEYDGEQHFKPIKYFGGQKAFERTIINDNIKNKFIENNTIYSLLRIKYTDFSNINKILDKTFNDHQKDGHRWLNIYGTLTE